MSKKKKKRCSCVRSSRFYLLVYTRAETIDSAHMHKAHAYRHVYIYTSSRPFCTHPPTPPRRPAKAPTRTHNPPENSTWPSRLAPLPPTPTPPTALPTKSPAAYLTYTLRKGRQVQLFEHASGDNTRAPPAPGDDNASATRCGTNGSRGSGLQ